VSKTSESQEVQARWFEKLFLDYFFLRFRLIQKAITKSVQAYVTVFILTGVFLGFFSLEIGQFQSTWARIGEERMVLLFILTVK